MVNILPLKVVLNYI